MGGCQVHEGKGGRVGEEKNKERRKSVLRIRRKGRKTPCVHTPDLAPEQPVWAFQLLSTCLEYKQSRLHWFPRCPSNQMADFTAQFFPPHRKRERKLRSENELTDKRKDKGI